MAPRITITVTEEIQVRLMRYLTEKKKSLHKQSDVVREAIDKFLASEGY